MPTASVTLTPADLIALHETPVEIIAAPGVGSLIALTRITAVYVAGNDPYTDNGGAATIGPPGQPPQFVSAFAGFWDQASSQVYSTDGGSLQTTLAGAEDQPFVIGQDTASPSGGDGAVAFTVEYLIVAA